MRQSTAFGHLAALFSIIVWAVTYVSSKILLESFSALDVTFLRIIIAYAALCVFSLFARLRLGAIRRNPPKDSAGMSNLPSGNAHAPSSENTISEPSPRTAIRHVGNSREGWFMLAGLTGVTGYFLLQNIGMTYTTATNTSIILNTIPVLTALLSWILLKDRSGIHLLFFLGFALAMGGIAIISLGGDPADLHLKGDLIILITAFDWSLYTLINRKLAGCKLSVLQITRRIYFWGLVWSVPFMIVSGFRPDLTQILRPANLLNLLFLGVVACAVCFISWNFALQRIGALRANIYIYVEPVISVTSSALILHEVITPRLLLGIVLSLLGVILSGLPRRSHGSKEECEQA